MLVFSTRLPLKMTTTQEECLQTFIDWIVSSPHYNISSIDYDISSHKDFDLTADSISIAFRHYKDDEIELSACRLENREKNAVWFTDCIFLCEQTHKSVLIQLNANRKNYTVPFPKVNKPYLVRMFIEAGYCIEDGGIPVVAEPLEVENGYYDICVAIMNGAHAYSMPSVYISRDYWDNTAVSANYLAKKLSGIAHVFVEKDCATAWNLRNDTNGNNAHTGYVGIYFPGTNYCQKHSIDYYSDYKEMAQEIINAVWKALINRLDSASYNWNQILALQARQKMVEWRDISENDQKTLQEYISAFDSENGTLRKQIDELNQQLYALRAERDSLRLAVNSKDENSCFYKMGKEPNLYASERNDLLYSILSQVHNKFEKSSRAYTILSSLLEANPRVGECAHVIEELRSIFRNGAQITQSSKTKLRDLGFEIEEDGRHDKIKFHNDPRYMFTVSKTPGDYREGLNLISDICKAIDVEKKI